VTEVAIPEVRVEIFSQPGFGDDNFVKGWTKISGGTSSYETDGDIVTIAAGDQFIGIIEKDLPNLVSDTYTHLQVKVGNVDGTWGVNLFDGSAWISGASGNGGGLFDMELPSGKTFTKIRLAVAGGGAKTAEFDYVFMSKGPMVVPTDDFDLIEDMEITLPLLEMGISGAKFTLPNNDGVYTGKILEFDRVIIYLQRQGATSKKVFGGRISDYQYGGTQENYHIDFDCLDLGDELHAPEDLLQTACVGVNGRTIIKDALEGCPDITDKFVDVDEEIASTHDLTIDESIPFEVINEISRKATTLGGVVGFDAYLDPAGNLHVFKRNKYTSSVNLAGRETYSHRSDFHRVRNKQRVYGAMEKTWSGSVGVDGLTEAITGWESDGYLSLSEIRVEGSYSVRAYKTGTGWAPAVYLKRTFASLSAKFKHNFRKLLVAIRWNSTRTDNPSDILIHLLAPDDANRFLRDIVEDDIPAKESFKKFDLDLGPAHEAASEYMGWKRVGSPDWSNIQGIVIAVQYGSIGSGEETIDLQVDRLHFLSYFSSLVEDSVSQAKYGVRVNASQEDEGLKSDDECQKKAQSLVVFLKDQIESLTFRVDGDNRFIPGDKQRAIVENDDLDAYFRILEIRHIINGVNWDTELKLSNEPKMIDYLFASTSPPRYAGATVIIPRDFGTIQEGVAVIV
jgi:hypothetical protein